MELPQRLITGLNREILLHKLVNHSIHIQALIKIVADPEKEVSRATCSNLLTGLSDALDQALNHD